MAEGDADLLVGSPSWLGYQHRSLELPVTYATTARGGTRMFTSMFDLPAQPARTLYDPRLIFVDDKAFQQSRSPVHLLGSPAGYSNAILYQGSEREAVEAIRAVVGELCSNGMAEPGHLFALYTPPALRDLLVRAGLVLDEVETFPTYRAELPGSGYDDYLEHRLSSKRRQRTRVERRRFADAGYHVQLVPLRETVNAAAPLVVQLEARHGRDLAADRVARSLVELAADFGNRAICLRAERNDQLVGVMVCLQWADTLYCRSLGLDEGALVDADEYFNLVFHEAVEVAYRLRLRQVDWGPTSDRAKELRGATGSPTYALRIDQPG